MRSQQLLQFVLSGITSGSIYALIALGFTLIYNSTQVINFAQGEFVMFGGLFAVTFHQLGLPTPLVFLLSVLAVTVIGIVFERLAINPIKNSSVVTLIIVTIGASILFKSVAMILWGRDPLTTPAFSGEKPIHIFNATMTPQAIWVVGITLAVVLLMQVFYKFSMAGKAMKACSVNRTAARLLGINASTTVMYSFALSAALGAVAGVIITPIAMTSFTSGGVLGLKGFAGAVLGGLGNPVGAVAGGLLLGLLESLSIGFISSGYKDAIAFLVLLLVLFVRPNGIFSRLEKEKV
ncbi:MAG: branched-chain amino acid ABC transporter permease [Actinobacteria bacterium]|nr:branched-chain amino acid ABC transporter permease [Actinomycetota bacterium]